MFDEFVEHVGSSSPGLMSPSEGPGLARDNGIKLMGNGGYSTSSSAGAGAGMSSGVPMMLEYEGFETDGKDGEEDVEEEEMGREVAGVPEGMETLEAGYYPKSSFGTTTDPIFSLSHVQFSLPSSLIRMQVNSNILVMALHPLSLILLDLTKPVELVNVDLPKPASAREGDRERETPSIKGIWGDPSGRHLLITTHGGDTFYLSTSNLSSMISTSGTSKANKPRPLRLRHPISAVAWSPTSVSPAPTASSSSSHSHAHAHTVDCLLGSPNGVISTLTLPPSDDIFNLNLKGISKSYERDHNSVYTVPNQAAVTGLGFGFWDLPSHSASPPQQQIHGHGYQRKTANERQVWIVATTADRVYEMHGSVSSSSSSSGGMNMVGRSGWAEEIFRPYRETGNVPKFQEIEADEKTSMLRFYETMRPSSSSSGVGGLQAQDVAWSTKTGLYASPVPACLSATGTAPDVFASPRLLGYPAKDRLVDFLLTEFHTIFLFENRIVGVSRLTDSIVWEDTLPLKVDEHASSLAYDPVHHTYWMYTDRALYEIVTTDEDRNVWRAKLDHADFESAAKYAKTSAQIDLVHSRHADNLFENGKFVQAAQIYAKSSRSFEYVALRFIDADEKDALRMYLADRLDRLDKKDLTQRMMLATWLIEIYLSKCNTLEDIIAAEAATSDVESMRVELQLMAEDLRNFITTYKSNLDRKVTYEMILSHGRTDIYLFYAELVKDHKVIIEHWIKEEEWSRVIEDLGRQDDLELYYRFSTILMTHRPSSTVDSWLRVPSIDVRRLIPALLLGEVVESARFLQAVIARGSTDSTIFNLLITLLAQDNNETKLIEFLSNTPDDPLADKPYYDLDYALRTCKASGRISSTVYIYSRMGLYENSVDLAIERGDPELAKINADKVDDDDTLRRRLWLKIAKYVVQEKRDIKSAMQFLESTDLLRIEDILPFFPDFAVIDDFKDEICKALEDYRENIDNLKAEMDEATRSAASIQGEIEKLQNRFMTVDVSERCSHCQALLMTRQFYVFPCQHVFHVDCLITLAKEYLSASTLRRIVHLQNELISLTKYFKTSGGGSHRQTADAIVRPTSAAGHFKDDSNYNLIDRTDNAGDYEDSSAATLLGLPASRNRLLVAGDKIRELILPDVLASAVSAVGAGFPLPGTGGFGSGGGKNKHNNANLMKAISKDPRDQARIEKLRLELDRLLASSCVLCEGSVMTLDKPFVSSKDDDGSWDI